MQGVDSSRAALASGETDGSIMSSVRLVPLDNRQAPPQSRVMPAGAAVLLSIAPAGLGSILLCGRRRVRLVLLLNGATLAAANLLFFAGRLCLTDETCLGLMSGICPLIGIVGARLALKDRYELIATGTPQTAATSLWMPLFWVAAAASGMAIGAGVPWAVLCFAFGSAHDPCVAFAAVLVLGALVLTGAVISVVCWIREVRK